MSFDKRISAYQASIRATLQDFFDKALPLIPHFDNSLLKTERALARSMCLEPGKRLRPILTLAAYRACGGKREKDVLLPALAFELLHNYTLVHDDIYDEDDVRRKEPTTYARLIRSFSSRNGARSWKNVLYASPAARFGVVAGFLNGEYIHNLAGSAILSSKISAEHKVRGLELLFKTFFADNTGQLLDLELETRRRASSRDYLRVIAQNTNELFMSAAQWGAILAGGTKAQILALRAFANDLGYAYKLKDDLLDIGIGGEKGRPVGSDIKKGKQTILLMDARAYVSSADKKIMDRIIGRNTATNAEIKSVIDIFIRSGSVTRLMRRAEGYVRRSSSRLKTARPAFAEPDRLFLEELAYWAYGRVR